jgi:TM2 domain-containing membrane protein YozV
VPDARSPQPSASTSPLARGLASPLGLTLLGLAQFTDFLTFRVMVATAGRGAELNPVALALHDDGGAFLVLAAKLAVWALVAAIAAVLAPTRPGLARFVVGFGIAAGILGTISNLLTL